MCLFSYYVNNIKKLGCPLSDSMETIKESFP